MFDTILLKILFPLKLVVVSTYLPPNAIYYMTEILQGLFLFYSELHPGSKYYFYSCCSTQSQYTGKFKGPPKPKAN